MPLDDAAMTLTTALRLQRVVVVANTASGSVGPTAPDTARAILESFGLQAQIFAPNDEDNIAACLDKAFATAPDLVIVLAGDGTARAAAERAGPRGPLVAPLPGGTMNMLPHAVYGAVKWEQALHDALERGVAKSIGGGAIDGKLFFVAAILGAPALWAQAREAARAGEVRKAIRRGAWALERAFSGRLRYQLNGGPRHKAEALSLLCPLISAAMPDDEQALEAAAFDPHGAIQAFRLGLHAIGGDWRSDPAVSVGRCTEGGAWASGRIPAILDGEPTRLGRYARIEYRPNACRVLAPPPAPAVTAPPKVRARRKKPAA
jgi:diacylglycerol kinase family enzyme